MRVATLSENGHQKTGITYSCCSALEAFHHWLNVQPHVKECLQMENTVGSRFGIHPSIKTERYRGSSQIKFESTDPETKKPWKTTNQAFGECTEVQGTTGLCNQGICSDVAKRVHKKIGIYGL